MAVDEARLQETLGRVVTDMAAAWSVRLVYLGDKLGLYRAMAGAGPLTSAELAERTGTGERYVREWLCNQAASGYVDYDPATGSFVLTDEQAAIFADEQSPAFLPGLSQGLASTYRDEPTLTERFRTGEGVGWHEHDPELFHGTARLFKPGYVANVVSSWIPALDGVADKLARGASVVDVGCGHGISTIILAQAYPASRFVGYDYHEASIVQARKLAAEAGVGDRVRFDVAGAKDYSGSGYDLVTFFDCLHDMGDPVGAARHVRQTLADEGTWMIVEPFANDRLEDNANPVGRIFYAASTLICTGASLAQEVGLALGAQAGEAKLRSVVEQAGFTRLRRATETPFNLILEARP
jgi:2-polyprenyl-3-methyl-5-hydroxy-6-metoxy-1,4-benzoquinol methylase